MEKIGRQSGNQSPRGQEREGLAMFSIGDLVVHPMHGAGVIDDIVRERVAGTTKEYYVFKMPMGGLLLKIPVSNSEAIGIRSIITQPEAEALLNAIPDMAVENTANWNKRYRENYEKLRGGNIYDVAEVVKCLRKRDIEKGLSTGERKMLAGARQVLLAELAAASGRDAEELFLSIGI